MSGRRANSKKPVTHAATAKPVGMFSHSDVRLFAITLAVTVTAGIFHSSGGNPVIAFVAAGAGLATLASLVSRSLEALTDHLGSGLTGVLQPVFGNLAIFFVVMFSLKAGLYEVVKATLVGSILANVLLVLGLAFVVGGLKHGRQHFNAQASRQLALLLTLSVFALSVPTLATALHPPAAEHARAVTVVVSLLLLLLFAASLPDTLRNKSPEGTVAGSPEALEAKSEEEHHGQWPLQVAVGILSLAGLGAALVSNWFVAALTPAIDVIGISEAFAGLIIVAIAGNAVENIVGIQLAAKNKSDYALQVILQSPVQVAMAVVPVVALCAGLVGAGTFTLVLSPLLLAVLIMAAIVAVLVVIDGDSTWFEGATLLVLYCAIATAFWWG